MTKLPDINAWPNMSLLRIVPETPRGEEWCESHINAEMYAGAYHAEHRYGPEILKAAHDQGLTVALDGQICDAPREFIGCASCPNGSICATLGGCFYEAQAEGVG